ncbi:Shedu anti-phage system protein SduA domain-containing protein [Tepidibacter aestuarii]|uniref:Shedu anti-phage system protein SduA domain-containing protein n=1 Tax=Tepidibacter aestuarii TaxID=2925782 RepID=UPI0020BF3495|nr:Shedu anti-phage system protein SduA domain-containing protein [Tepidibacter aestuarii]CAH2213883.1 protein of unknown function [Tepidibacter aestuarii]
MKYDDSGRENDIFKINLSFYEKLVDLDLKYIYTLPIEYKYKKLVQINRFIELIGNKETREIDITKFLSRNENKFILTMGFLSKEIYPELACKWQSEDIKDIRPDFFVLKPNNYADIVEFKLPDLKSKSIVGKHNREVFSAELQSYIGQTRKYKTYFEDPNNRKWFEEKYGFKVLKPKRILVVGRRWNFSDDVWKEIQADYSDFEIITYDDLVDGVTAQFYM